jgi:hypothetical protein
VFWAAKLKLAQSWAEIRMGIQGFILFFGGHFLVWLLNLAMGQLKGGTSVWVYGLVTGLLALALIVFYVQQERS